jgi:hypothetical protein
MTEMQIRTSAAHPLVARFGFEKTVSAFTTWPLRQGAWSTEAWIAIVDPRNAHKGR